ncbi:MAG: histidine triad nucleotide-binding protein [Verrucomicrobia bacterium]|nr:MAG: histidine triad nucleotide-binding protein [Verrucomicrobiota bacterium]
MTLFEKIIHRQIPAEIVWEDEEVLAFRDVNPQAPVHILVVPKEPVSSISAVEDKHALLLGKLLLTANRVAKEEGISQTGFRLVINRGANGGETIPHLHVHILGGRLMKWPPG